MLIARAEVDGRGPADVRIGDGAIVEIGSVLRPGRDEDVIDAEGGALLPGLHDHHIHLRALAASYQSVRVGPPSVGDADSFVAALRTAAAHTEPGDWVRAVGYHESVAGPLSRSVLDAAVADRPLRVQHRSGELWVLNTLGLGAVGLDDSGVGEVWRGDSWLKTVTPPVETDFERLSREAAAFGVTGFTDADPERTETDLDRFPSLTRQQVWFMAPPPLPGMATKVLLDDRSLPALDPLGAVFSASHGAGRPVAVHCVTRVQLVVTLAALEEVGSVPGDRIEHAAVVPPELIPQLRRLGVTVVTQPNFVAERGESYVADVDPDERPYLYRVASLQRAGVPVAGGTDAPFGSPDVWAAMRAAVSRQTATGDVLGPGERVSPLAALQLFLGSPTCPGRVRRVEVGAPADLCLLRAPLAEALCAMTPDLVRLTVVDGQLV
ncbi:MAG TPA: amidohydrolase family protein [Acidimicrobiales bacterium]